MSIYYILKICTQSGFITGYLGALACLIIVGLSRLLGQMHPNARHANLLIYPAPLGNTHQSSVDFHGCFSFKGQVDNPSSLRLSFESHRTNSKINRLPDFPTGLPTLALIHLQIEQKASHIGSYWPSKSSTNMVAPPSVLPDPWEGRWRNLTWTKHQGTLGTLVLSGRGNIESLTL